MQALPPPPKQRTSNRFKRLIPHIHHLSVQFDIETIRGLAMPIQLNLNKWNWGCFSDSYKIALPLLRPLKSSYLQ